MAPKGSPRMLYAASLLASTDGKIPVKVALSRAGFSAEEIAKEKKQRQARRRRDFLLKKRAMKKIKGRRAMTTLPLSLPRSVADVTRTIDLQEQQEQEQESANVMSTPSSFEYDMDSHQEVIHDTSRLDALILACSMQQPITSDLTFPSDEIPSFSFSSNDLNSTSYSSSSEINENSCTSI
jgi:hypothetical protein